MKSERASGHLPRAPANYELEGKKKIRGNLDSNADTSMKITRRSKSKMGGGIRNPPRSNLPSLGVKNGVEEGEEEGSWSVGSPGLEVVGDLSNSRTRIN